MTFQIMGTKHLGVPDAKPIIGSLDAVLTRPHATPIYDAMCYAHGCPSGFDYQAYLRPWSDI